MRLREIVSRRESARDTGYEMLSRATRFYDGLHADSFEAKLLRAFSDVLGSLDEMRELLYPLATGQGVADEPPDSGQDPRVPPTTDGGAYCSLEGG